MKSPLLATAMFLLPSQCIWAGDAAPVAREAPILMAPFVVYGQSARETGLAISVNLRKIKNSSGLVIDEPLVTEVALGSVAAAAGIAKGDRLVRIGDLKLAGLDPARWHDEFVKSHNGQTVVFAIRKQGSQELRLLKFRFQSAAVTAPSSKMPNQSREPTPGAVH